MGVKDILCYYTPNLRARLASIPSALMYTSVLGFSTHFFLSLKESSLYYLFAMAITKLYYCRFFVMDPRIGWCVVWCDKLVCVFVTATGITKKRVQDDDEDMRKLAEWAL